jgi:chromosome segregation ATPase
MTSNEQNQSTRDRVFAICSDLHRQNKKPTVRLVLSMLPDISSTSSVHKPFKEWMEMMEAQERELHEKLGLSEAFMRAVSSEIRRLGAEANDNSNNWIIEAKEQRDQALEDLYRTEEHHAKQGALLEAANTELLSIKAELMDMQRTHEATLTEIRRNLDEEKHANQTLAATHDTLKTELAKVQIHFEFISEQLAETKLKEKAAQTESLQLRDSHSLLAKELSRLEAALEGREQLITELKETSLMLRSDIAAIEARRALDVAEHRKENSLLKEEKAVLSHQITESQRQLIDSKHRADELLKSNAELRAASAERTQIIDTLTAANKNGKTTQ